MVTITYKNVRVKGAPCFWPLVIIALLVSSCNTNVKVDNSDTFSPKPNVAPCIKEAFDYFVLSEHADTSAIYSIRISIGYFEYQFNDTTIGFHRTNKADPTDGLRGLTTIGGYRVLIFDEHDIGGRFYNPDSLKDVELDKLKLSTDSIELHLVLVIDDGFLWQLGCQASDFVPIKVK